VRLFAVALILALAWSVLALGGSPTWAAAAALVLAVTAGILGMLERPNAEAKAAAMPMLRHRTLSIALVLVLASVAIQLVPFPKGLTARLSPARDDANFALLVAAADRQDPANAEPFNGDRAAISIVSFRTVIGLAGLTGLAILLLGTLHGFSIAGTRGIARAIAVLGVAVTMIGLYQLTANTRLVYGWYVPLFADGSSAPFINPNHQAGWLVMLLSLTLGGFAGEVARGMRGVAPRWRDRILWLSSKDASVAVLLLFASALMAAGILATRSRSGAAVMMFAFLADAWWNGRKQPTRLGKMATAAGVIAVGLAMLAWNGAAVLQEIAQTEGSSGRFEIWHDTQRIISDFWLTGTGFNTYGAAMLYYQPRQDGVRFIEAHNDYLQLIAEGGLLVGIPFLILAIAVIAEIRKRFREAADDTRTYWLRVGAVTGLIALALQSTIEFTLQMPGGAMMFTVLLAIAMHHPPPRLTHRVERG